MATKDGSGDRGRDPPTGYLGASWKPGEPPAATLSRGRRRAALRAAQEAWDDGRPGSAWDILREAGMEPYALLQARANLSRARDRFEQAMSHYTQ